ncbi:AI-2E family transporter [Virgibacillus profundi]|uniref:AI-2E family transporter n=1 Tax=Virgibacillus profundi TaxID=2024555 RepID=A0A2A2ICG0_9BACI|nr:AI-2E family transporter [Virgibacillus profundi]PAV28954.1 AI-2E family transporter [Virgibacillus profundi]PXY53122.1 AI-2E family transporter [Virgibacillus profundi]
MLKDKKVLIFVYSLIIGIFVFLFVYLLVKLFPLYGTVFSFLWSLLSPFLIACLIAYLLYPVINKLHSYNIPRGLAILSIYLLFFGSAAYLIYRVYPMMIHQLRDLNEQLPQFISMYENLVYNLYDYTSFLPEAVHDKIDQMIVGVENTLNNLLTKLIGGFTKIFDMIIILTVIPVLVFYFLKDFNTIKKYAKKFIPEKYQQQASKMCHAIDDSLGSYIRGQLFVCLFVSITTLIIFHLLDIKYALLLAIFMGITNIIPYFGPIIGAIPAVAITFTMSGKMVIFILIAIFVIQLIESNLLSPYIVGKSINIHPVAIIFVLLLGGKLFGVLGMILAVPLLTILRVIVNHLIAFRRYN